MSSQRNQPDHDQRRKGCDGKDDHYRLSCHPSRSAPVKKGQKQWRYPLVDGGRNRQAKVRHPERKIGHKIAMSGRAQQDEQSTAQKHGCRVKSQLDKLLAPLHRSSQSGLEKALFVRRSIHRQIAHGLRKVSVRLGVSVPIQTPPKRLIALRIFRTSSLGDDMPIRRLASRYCRPFPVQSMFSYLAKPL